jgi:hypothetical protein
MRMAEHHAADLPHAIADHGHHLVAAVLAGGPVQGDTLEHGAVAEQAHILEAVGAQSAASASSWAKTGSRAAPGGARPRPSDPRAGG